MSLELARQQWQDGARRLREASRDPREGARLLAVEEALVTELRRRLGGSYTLDELVTTYDRADDWLRDVIAENAPVPGWERSVALVGDAAFHRFARGAIDYEP